MKKPIIEVKNIWKKYKRGVPQRYYSLRDTLMNYLQNIIPHTSSPSGKNLSESEFWALKDVSFTVHSGEAVGVIGRNGAGKSTLLKLLSRITYLDRGEIILGGRVASLLEIGTGFHPELTGRENIYLNGSILGMTQKEVKLKIDEIIDFAEVEKFINTPVKYYSSGMYTRLAFSVAAHLESEILLIDEVLAVGDSGFQKKCIEKMSEVTNTNGRTILFVSHNMNIVQNLCPRCIYLEDGQVEAIGETRKIVEKYLAQFSMSKNILLSDRIDRRGTGQLLVKEIYFLNKFQKKVNILKSGETIRIVIKYKLRDVNIKKIDFTLDFDSFNTLSRVASVSNIYFNHLLSTKSRQIQITIPRLPFAPGRYTFTIFIRSENGDILDWIKQAGSIEVEYGDYYNTGRIPQLGESNFLIDFEILHSK